MGSGRVCTRTRPGSHSAAATAVALMLVPVRGISDHQLLRRYQNPGPVGCCSRTGGEGIGDDRGERECRPVGASGDR